jgi:phosphomannomutase
MMEENAVFGGEVTGHYYFKDYFMCDSGLAPVMYLLDLLSQKEESLAEIVDKMEEIYFISGEINTKGVDKDKVFKLIEEKYGPTANEIIRVDGLTMEYDNWHFNVRASNTEPLVRLNLEADSKKLMEEKRDEVLAVIKSCI